MTKGPLISLITVVYNGEQLITGTLNSAIQQSYKNIELVIVDGGSTDHTLDRVQEFKSHIGTIISEKDNGIYDAMNKGIKAAKGEWLYFLNVGDSFYDNKVLEKVFSEPISNEISFIYGKVQTINEPTGINYITGKPVSIVDFYSHYPICHQATFTRKSAFEQIGLYNTRYQLAADTEWFARFFKKNQQGTKFLNQLIAFYDIQGATYHKRMEGYKEYLQFGYSHFPWLIATKNVLAYPLIWLKVKLIRIFTGTKLFAAYRKLRFHSA